MFRFELDLPREGVSCERLRRIIQHIAESNVKGVHVGVLQGATSENGGTPVAQYAACNEYGTKNIPMRPFMRVTLKEQKENWVKLMQRSLKAFAEKPECVRLSFDFVARTAVADMRDTIKSNMPPANNPEYLRRKQANRQGGGYVGTLFNTGTMLNSINYDFLRG